MAKTLKVEIATPDRQVYSGEAEMVVAPGVQGELGVLPRHTHLMAALDTGEMRLTVGGKIKRYAVSAGFMEVTPERAMVLADSAELAEEISVERAQKAVDRARQRLRKAAREEPEINPDRAKLALIRAINRLRVAKKK